MEHLILKVTAKFCGLIHNILGKELELPMYFLLKLQALRGKKFVFSTDSVMFGKIPVTSLSHVEYI
jgi:hypothetical protein